MDPDQGPPNIGEEPGCPSGHFARKNWRFPDAIRTKSCGFDGTPRWPIRTEMQVLGHIGPAMSRIGGEWVTVRAGWQLQ
jgi:hypothetical protein